MEIISASPILIHKSHSTQEMSKIVVSTYEGVLVAYELEALPDGLKFKQLINSQESSGAIKCL